VTKRLVTMFILAAVFIGLLMYIRFFETGAGKKEKTEDSKNTVILDLAKEDFRSIEITRAGETIRIDKEGNGWRMKAPVDARMAPFAGGGIAGLLGHFTAVKKIPGKMNNPAEFGMDNPEIRVTVDLANGKKEDIRIGAKTPVGDNYYVVRKGDPSIYVVSGFDAGKLRKTADELRDKSIAGKMRRDDVSSLSVRSGNSESVCLRNDRKQGRKDTRNKKAKAEKDMPLWHFEGRPGADCEAEMDEILSSIEFTQAQGFVEAESVKPAELGLDEPRYVLEIRFKNRAPWRFKIGGEASPGSIYFKNEKRNEIYKIEQSFTEKIDLFRKAASKI